MSYTLTIIDPHRAALFRAVFGTDQVQVTTLEPIRATIPDLEGSHLVYELDLSALEPEQMENLIEYAAQKWNTPQGTVTETMLREGFPVLAEGAAIRAISRPNFTLDIAFPRHGTGGG
jgi:hypothetical protein